MITSAVLYAVSLIPLGLFTTLGLQPVTAIFVGTVSIDAVIILFVSYWISFIGVFWPLQPVLYVMLAYIPIKLTLLTLRAIIGQRIPDAS
jgi:hypothetical protein